MLWVHSPDFPPQLGGVESQCPLQGVVALVTTPLYQLSSQLPWQFPWFTLCSSLGSLSVPPLPTISLSRAWGGSVVGGVFLFPLRFDSGGFCPGPNCLGRACSGSALQPQVTDPPRKGGIEGDHGDLGLAPPLSLTERSVVGSPPISLPEIFGQDGSFSRAASAGDQ